MISSRNYHDKSIRYEKNLLDEWMDNVTKFLYLKGNGIYGECLCFIVKVNPCRIGKPVFQTDLLFQKRIKKSLQIHRGGKLKNPEQRWISLLLYLVMKPKHCSFFCFLPCRPHLFPVEHCFNKIEQPQVK